MAELRAIQPFDFQNWVFEKLHGGITPRKVGDFGVDGWIELVAFSFGGGAYAEVARAHSE